MAEIKILIEGYVKIVKGTMRASPASVLIKDSGKNILVDPGANSKLLLNKLKKEGLSPKDIDIVFLTHYHPDHILNIRLFPKNDIYDGNTIYRDDEEIEFSGKIPGTNVKVIDTPGHAHEHASLLVETKIGKVCVAGDLWWWKDGQEQKIDKKSLLNLKDPYVKVEKDLLESRKKILKIADWIIPGHGKMFRVK